MNGGFLQRVNDDNAATLSNFTTSDDGPEFVRARVQQSSWTGGALHVAFGEGGGVGDTEGGVGVGAGPDGKHERIVSVNVSKKSNEVSATTHTLSAEVSAA